MAQERVRSGADRILESPYLDWIQGKRVGLITHRRDLAAVSTWELLARHPEVEVVALFGPEHGLLGQAQAGDHVPDYGTVYSLYGDTRAPTTEMLEDVEVLIYDIQDVGVRFYTYISTMYLSMQVAATKGIPFIVLDRPNPIDGSRVEGPVLQAEHASFIGLPGLPIRYGMTPGELAQMLNKEEGLGCDLRVVPWAIGSATSGTTGPPWSGSHPLQYAHPHLRRHLSGFRSDRGHQPIGGRGTTRPFELVGAPWLNGRELAKRLNHLQLAGGPLSSSRFPPPLFQVSG